MFNQTIALEMLWFCVNSVNLILEDIFIEEFSLTVAFEMLEPLPQFCQSYVSFIWDTVGIHSPNPDP